MDPIKIEKLFEKVSSELKLAGSERTQLFLIYEFLSSLNGKYRAYDSYIIQLFDAFPTLNQPLLFTGINPEEFARVINDCEKVISAIPELKEKELMRKIDFLKSGLYQIHDWLGLKNEAELRRELLPAQMATGQKRGKEKSASEVLVPVVETSGNFRSKGRLRRLKVEVVGAATSEKAELRPVFGVIGANAGSLGEQAAEAAVKLLKESTGKRSFWKGTASFELSHAWHAGDSANLALSGLFYCEMLRAENRREYFRLNPGIAITGNIDEQGNVLPVDAGTIRYKIEAAFYSWVQVLVVPLEQVEEATNYLGELESEYPSRNLVLKGVGHVRELFYDRRLTMHKQRSVIKHTSMQIWRHRYNWAFLLVVLVLLGVIGRLIYGPVDRNPVYVDFEGEFLILENTNGAQVSRINVGEIMAESMEKFRYLYPTFVLHDINKDGFNELIWGSASNSTEREKSYIRAWSVSGDTLMWKQEMKFNFRLPKQQAFVDGVFFINEIKVVDTKEGEKIIALTTQSYSFPAVVSLMDIETGEIEQEYYHSGHLTDLELIDLNKDGYKEALLTGVNNAYWEACLVVLDPENISGHSPLKGDYIVENTSKAKEIYYVFIPKTKVGEALSGIQKFTQGRRIYKEEENNVFWVEVMETARTISGITEDAFVTAYFDFDMNPTGFGTSNLYDIIAKELKQSGDISFIPDYDYFESFKDSLLYWNGESFQHEPTMNKEYLRAVGELTGGK